MFYNDKNPTSVPKKVIIKYKTMAALESFMKEAFDVPANKSVKLAFKPTGEQEKQRFLEDYVADQLSIAVAVYIGDVSCGSVSIFVLLASALQTRIVV